MNLPKQVTKTMYVMYHTECWRTEENRVSLWPLDTSRNEKDDVLLGTIEVAFDVPQNVDVVGTQVANLRKQRDDLVAKAAAGAAKIDRQIQELLALPAPAGGAA